MLDKKVLHIRYIGFTVHSTSTERLRKYTEGTECIARHAIPYS